MYARTTAEQRESRSCYDVSLLLLLYMHCRWLFDVC